MPKREKQDESKMDLDATAGQDGQAASSEDAVPIDLEKLKSEGQPSEEDVAKRREQMAAEKASRKEERRKRRETSRNPFVRFGLMIGRTAHEIGQIVWPSGKTTAKMSVATVIVVVLLAAFIIGMDFGASKLVGLLYSLRP